MSLEWGEEWNQRISHTISVNFTSTLGGCMQRVGERLQVTERLKGFLLFILLWDSRKELNLVTLNHYTENYMTTDIITALTSPIHKWCHYELEALRKCILYNEWRWKHFNFVTSKLKDCDSEKGEGKVNLMNCMIDSFVNTDWDFPLC